jgi:hypothetical protein
LAAGGDPSGAKEEPLRLKPTKQGLQPDGIGNYYINEDFLEDDLLLLTCGEAVYEPKS